MSVTTRPSARVRMTLVSASRWSSVAVGVLASGLEIERRAAARLLARWPAVLAEDVPLTTARRLAPLLSALGLTIRLEAPGTPAADLPLEVALQPLGRLEADRLSQLVRRLGLPRAAICARLRSPTGLVLSLPASAVAALRQDLRAETNLRLLVSCPAQARYDLFLRCGRRASAQLSALLRQLGVGSCALSGAVAGALDRRTATLILRRHAVEVRAMNRDFQRFDLFLSGGLARPELADFLATRAALRSERLPPAPLSPGMRLESGLSRSAAHQFRADYAQLGLETRIALRQSAGICDG